ncbi:MAG: PrsW family glutamic-type intramembrane protease [Candidatus Poseidoniaceae archaeon]|nr:PrsW family glutamic-type intramembrane protease [Candidatus Poseidoniaceae archaeon]
MQGSIESSTSHLQSESRWSSVARMLGIVILLWVLAQFIILIAAGFLDGDLDGDFGPLDGALIIAGTLCSTPLAVLLLFMRRPKLEHLIIAEPTIQGQHVHSLPNSKILQTPVPTRIRQFIIRSRHPLRVPVAKHLWMLFLGGVIISSIAFAPLLIDSSNIGYILLALFVAIPAWLVGFSTPVFAWWSFSSSRFHLSTTRQQGEAMLIAGMLSTFPALIINSFIAPGAVLFLSGGQASYTLIENITVIISAPVGEEICKALAVFSLAGLIDSKKRGFQVGFTVGLGFALLENLQYILISLFAGELMAVSYGFTTVVRGIGSIPGHALWTACSGYAIGHILEQRKQPNQIPDVKQWDLVNPLAAETSNPYLNSEQYMRNSLFSKSSNLQLPTSLPVMLGIAMFGHAFWNGSSVLMSYVARSVDPVVGLVLDLTWIAILITLLWIIGRFVIAAAMEE